MKRLPPARWARILAWTAAALSWGTTAVALASGALEEPALPAEAAPTNQMTATPTQTTVPMAPESGLVVIRFTPVEPPAPEVITVQVAGPAPTVQSSGS